MAGNERPLATMLRVGAACQKIETGSMGRR
jgi:hypothetical protein